MSSNSYLEAVRAVTHHIENTQMDAISKAADAVIHSITHGGIVYLTEIGHGNQYDFLNRAGGLAAVQHFTYSVHVNAPTPAVLAKRPHPDSFDGDVEAIRYAVTTGMRAGDVLMVSSVSGKGRGPIELAIQARKIGVTVIGLTSMDYTSQVEATHPSGKRLFEVVDIVLDNGAPYGDAVVTMPGFDYKVCPISGVSMVCLGWVLWGTVMERMAATGDPPTVYRSVNSKGGQEFYNECRKVYDERGY